MAIKAIAFDIDGTLYPNRRMHRHSLTFLLANLNFVRRFGKVRHQIRELDGDIVDFRATQAKLFAAEAQISIDRATTEIERIMYQKWERIFKNVRPFEGIKDELHNLKQMGLDMAAMSDFPVGKKLEYFGLQDYFKIQMSSEESGYLKPDKRPFLDLALRLGYAPHEIIYVGNSYSYDVEGARSVGMHTVHISAKPGENPADITVKDYRGFADKIESYMKKVAQS